MKETPGTQNCYQKTSALSILIISFENPEISNDSLRKLKMQAKVLFAKPVN